MGYRDTQPACLPLDKLPLDAFVHELHKRDGRKYVSLNGHPTFFEVINAGLATKSARESRVEQSGQAPNALQDGLDSTPEVIYGWLRLPRKSLSKLLPELLNLMAIYVADDDSDGECDLGAECSPETFRAEASKGTQLEALEEDVAKIPVSQRTPPKPR